ncbi:acyltransferase [Nocardioides sp. zg-1228]|uniref:acyltransferase family protein n=1 Tax=Nocardioides sp. zg-1228 TaxID=2763008 RepID=UPI001642D954|nr:acyltransferase [Nocardioides sp. zg-1228]MBC2934432.1 acyltransferase [Nocardioides sp. zg-1228]QSF59196.1 acyltransferase [Nocardioides sp. zg-1228]
MKLPRSPRWRAASPHADPAVEFPVLDTLRAIGALAVLTTHTAFQSGDYLRNGVWGTILARLDVGVAIFFVLSGFLLSRPWLARAADSARPPSTRRYYEKRLLRIYPVYLVTVVIALVLIPDNEGAGLGTWVSSLLLADPYTSEKLPHGLTQMWSLTAEAAFYVLLPILMRLAIGSGRGLRPWRVLAVATGMVAVNVLWIYVLAGLVQDHTDGAPGLWLPAFASWFAVGIVLALVQVLHDRGQLPVRARAIVDVARMPGVCWAIIGGLVLVAATPVAGPVMFQVGSDGQIFAKHLLYAVIGGLMVLTGVFADRAGTYARVMSWPLLRHLGHISYGVFCIHLAMLSLIYAVTDYSVFSGDGLPVWALSVVLSVLAAELLYRVIEVPSARIADRWRREESRASAPRTEQTAASTR